MMMAALSPCDSLTRTCRTSPLTSTLDELEGPRGELDEEPLGAGVRRHGDDSPGVGLEPHSQLLAGLPARAPTAPTGAPAQLQAHQVGVVDAEPLGNVLVIALERRSGWGSISMWDAPVLIINGVVANINYSSRVPAAISGSAATIPTDNNTRGEYRKQAHIGRRVALKVSQARSTDDTLSRSGPSEPAPVTVWVP